MLSVILTLLIAVPPMATATDNTEIPGVPLPSTLVIGEIGGPAVDLVYSLEVERGTSLLLTLRGSVGAELGLYVFGDEATSVLTDEPLASSAKPGANQSIAIQFFESTRIFININGRNLDRPYTFQLISSVVVDRTPPVVRVAAAVGVGRGSNVCARIEAFDRISGVQSVAVATEGSSATPNWRAYRGGGQYCADLALPEGKFTLEVLVRNAVGMITSVNAGVIRVDNQAPVVSLGQPLSAVMLVSSGLIAFKVNEPFWFVGPRSAGVSVMTQTGEALTGTVKFSEDRTRVRWQPRSPVPVGTVLVAMLGQIRDAAGNLTTPSEPHIVTRKQRTSLDLALVRRTNTRIVLLATGSRNLIGSTVAVEVRNGRSWVFLKSIVLTSSRTQFGVAASDFRQVRVVWQGSDLLHRSVGESPSFN